MNPMSMWNTTPVFPDQKLFQVEQTGNTGEAQFYSPVEPFLKRVLKSVQPGTISIREPCVTLYIHHGFSVISKHAQYGKWSHL